MISILHDIPENVAAIYSVGNTTREDFVKSVIPHIKKKISEYKQLNYMIYINGTCDDCSLELLLRESMEDIKSITDVNRFAIVSNLSDTDIYSKFFRTLPDFELKMFSHQDLYKALFWCHNGKNSLNA